MVIDGYFIGGYSIVPIGEAILLVVIFCYYKLYYDYWWLHYYKLLLDILSYIVIGYYWIFEVILL